MTKKEYIKLLKEMVEEDNTFECENIYEAIFQIDDLLISGNFEQGFRGNDHNCLLFEGVSWSDILTWGTIIIPETKCYISNEPHPLLVTNYERLPLHSNHIVGFKEEAELVW